MAKLTDDEAAEFITYDWKRQCPDDIRQYDFRGDPVFISETQFSEAFAAYMSANWWAITPGSELYESIKACARAECNIKDAVLPSRRLTSSYLRRHLGPGERVLVGKAILDFLNTPDMLELAPPGRGDLWTASMVRNNVERGELPIASGLRKPWRCTTTALIDWFTARNITHANELDRLTDALRQRIVAKRKHAREVRYAQKLRDWRAADTQEVE
jgi:hypothetical protein